jgi:uncharacterized membrane protein
VLFAMGAIALMSSVQTTILELAYTISDQKAATVMWSAIAFTLPAALLWSYRDELWSTLQLPGLPMEKPFQPIARGVMLASMMMVSYGLSFHGVWANFYMISQPAQQAVKPLFMEYLPIVLNPNVLILGLLTLVGWVCLLRPAHDQGHWGLTERDTTILLLLVVLTGVPIWNYIVQPIAVVATFIINSVVFVLATGLMRQGLARGDRLPFWSGLMFLTVTILSRFFEYNTSLLFKSLAFGLCGLGIILIGLWFERNIRTLTRLSVPLEETP